MNLGALFTEDPKRDGRVWMRKCFVLGSIVLVGWLTGYLQAASILAIAIFGVVQGILPYRSVIAAYLRDANSCRQEKAALQNLTFAQAANIAQIQTPNMGTLFRGVQFILAQQDRLDGKAALSVFLALERSIWEKRLAPLANSVEQAPTLGLFGTVVGLALGMGELTASAGPQGMVAAIGTALGTTLAGCVAGFLLSGLYSIAETGVERHLAEIKLLLSLLLKLRDNDSTDNPNTLF
jgi:biopolymer transport protein ExbB/TolQ